MASAFRRRGNGLLGETVGLGRQPGGSWGSGGIDPQLVHLKGAGKQVVVALCLGLGLDPVLSPNVNPCVNPIRGSLEQENKQSLISP
jgi:hypothetical protein